MYVDSPSLVECLPQDMLEAVLGKLDREDLCSARLVSQTFCAAASANISSLTLRPPIRAVSLERFSRLEHVTVHYYVEPTDDSLARIDRRLRAVITHLTVSSNYEEVPWIQLPKLPGMPKLRELAVDSHTKVAGAEVLRRLTNLEVLRIGGGTPAVAMTITTTTWLTSLVIGLVTHKGPESADFSWVQHATNLRKLEALQITVSHKALPLLGNLMSLTGLTWLGSGVSWWGVEETYSIAPLSRLNRLRSVQIDPSMSEGNLAIACSLGLGSLAKLCFWVSQHASADCGRLLSRQTALTHLGVGRAYLCTLRHMGGLRMEVLQSLELWNVRTVDAEGLDVLRRATSLTKLHIGNYIKQPDARLSKTLGRLTQLRHLHLQFFCAATTQLNLRFALGPLTALTNLLVSPVRLDNGDLQALLGLTSLQALDLRGCRLTDDVVPELAVLTNLKGLRKAWHQPQTL